MSDYGGRRGGGGGRRRDEGYEDVELDDYDDRGRSRSGGRGGGGRDRDRSRDRYRSPDRDRGGGGRGGGGGGDGPQRLQRLDSIQDPGKKYTLKDCIGSGVCGDVYEAYEEEASEFFYFSVCKRLVCDIMKKGSVKGFFRYKVTNWQISTRKKSFY